MERLHSIKTIPTELLPRVGNRPSIKKLEKFFKKNLKLLTCELFFFADETLNSTGKQPKRGRGGRKKSTRPPSPAILRQRRVAANARERRRMNGLNDAFERLREVRYSKP